MRRTRYLPACWAMLLLSVPWLWACQSRSTETRTYRSPAGVYSVVVRGSFERPRYWFFRSRVTAHVNKADAFYEDLGVLRDADRRDASFDELFSANVWETQNVLHFFDASGSPGSCDSMLIENASGASIPAIKVDADDLVLGFDIRAATEIRIPLAPAPDPSGRYVTVDLFDSKGDSVRSSATVATDGMKLPIEFAVRLTAGSVSIVHARPASESLTFNGRCSR